MLEMVRAALVLSAVSKTYGSIPALTDIDLLVAPGEVVGLIGPNGAGKSTLLQLTAGLLAPDRGEIRIFGQAYAGQASAILARVGVVFQSRSLDLDLTVRRNLQFHGNLFGLAGPVLAARIALLGRQLAIEKLLDKPVRILSGGNQRRVEIARALLNEPALLLLDEPLTGLDPQARRDTSAHLLSLGATTGAAIVWATHLIEELASADRLFVLAEGKIAFSGSGAEMMTATGTNSLTSAYLAIAGTNEAVH